jgi:hypothetical protein
MSNNRPDQSGRVARGQLQVILIDACFVIGVTVEKHIGDVVRFTALEDGLLAVLLVDLLLSTL